MRKLYIFNPDHDLALASDSDHFDAPQSAKVFARDFSALPLWYSAENAVHIVSSQCCRDAFNASVYTETIEQSWLQEQQKLFPQLKNSSLTTQLSESMEILPWGWNKTIRRYFEKKGASQLPSVEQLERLRTLQHRKLAIEATTFLQSLENPTLRLTKPASVLTSADIENFVAVHPFAIFKAPWSGSGKGIVRSLGCLPENLLNRVKNIAIKQGSVIAEPLYTIIQDFAMEFSCKNGKTDFVGYSWFYTNEHGAYQGNLLASNEFIVNKLQEWISAEDLHAIQNALITFISKNIAPHYTGFVGVDMFIYKEDGQFFVHPCVEFNLRMTMGVVARLFYDRFVENGKIGSFSVDFFNNSEDLLADHTTQSSKTVHIINGKIQNGYLSLTPVTKDTHYRARVEIIA